MTRSRRTARFASLVLTAGLLVVACGGDSDESSGTTSGNGTTNDTTATSGDPAAEKQVVSVAYNSTGSFPSGPTSGLVKTNFVSG